jgi:hypothetical protein
LQNKNDSVDMFGMDFRISIQAQMESAAAAQLAAGLRRAINGLAGVSYTGQVINQSESDGTETLLVGMPPNNVSAVLNMVKSHTGRPGLGPVTVEIATDGLRASFEPQVLTLDQLKRLAGALSGP